MARQKEQKKNVYCAKKAIKIWAVDIKNIVISEFVETKNNSQYLIGYLDKVIRPAVLILPKMSGYVKTFKVKDNNKLSFCIDDD